MSDDLMNAQRIKAHRLSLLLASMVALCLTLQPCRADAQYPFPGASLMTDKTLALFDVQIEKSCDFDQFYALDHDQASLSDPPCLYDPLPRSIQSEMFQALQEQLASHWRLNNDEDAENILVQDTIYRASNISDLAISPRRGRVVGYMSGAWASQDSQGDGDDYSGFDVSSWGGGLGQDWKFLEHCIWGYGLQAVQSKISPNSGNYNSKLDSFSGYARMSIFDAMWRFDVVIGATKSWQKQHYFQTDSYNRFTTSQWFLETEFGARFDKGYTRIEPLVNFRAINLSEPKKASVFLTSTSFNKDFTDASYRLKVGSRFSWETDM
ncbi:MAG: autotransporter outer membrane beta-barrel domain-containing protein, partial [Planctomycetia bacterium]|nr:autotransporter outer membrane beta-barrel domain-containing protein [Planctomycetia bacterium]